MSFDRRWETDIYQKGRQLNVSPYDVIVSFIFSNVPPEKRHRETRVLEVGCGAGNNLLFCAQLGLSAHGIDGSSTAIEVARANAEKSGANIEFVVGDFSSLPWGDDSFDVVIDRCALCHNQLGTLTSTLDEIARVMKPDGVFFSNGFHETHPAFIHASEYVDGAAVSFSAGYFKDIGQVYFCSDKDIQALYGSRFNLISLTKTTYQDMLKEHAIVSAAFQLVARQKSEEE